MDRRKYVKQFIRRAKRSLNLEHSLPKLQYGILISTFLSAAILLVSRLFVFPYYGKVAIYAGVGAILAVVLFIWWKRIREKEALHRLDYFYPHNELVTALSMAGESNPLVDSILQKAVKESPSAFEQFKKRKKSLWKPKALVGIVLMVIIMGGLSIFPSATQQQALVIEKEQNVIDDLEKEVAELEKKTESKEMKKQLQELQNKLKELDSSEEALREVVKKQKELKLQEQKLKEKQDLAKQDNGQEGAEGLTAEEQKKLEELMELQKELTSTANSTQTALSKLGKPISFDLQNAIASELGSESTDDSSNGETNDSSSDSEGQQNGNQGNESSGQSGQNQGQGQNQGNSSQGQGNGTQGQGQGNGAGAGQGTGGAGQGNGSSGAGLGQGSRDLLSIPERVGGGSETTADGGPLGGGTAVGEQKGSVPVTKGTIRPYEEVIGDYRDSYLKSSERMQLPKDLQDIVQSYFSSIESE